MDLLLEQIKSPEDLKRFSPEQLGELAVEIREALCRLVQVRSAHFASNLGVVELAIGLHTTFDFSRDRLIWDTGHQVYPHKLLTGRYEQFSNIRTRGGLMGYPNPQESLYDLFMTGHAGCSVSSLLGLCCADDREKSLAEGDSSDEAKPPRKAVAVIGDGALVSGVVFEALNNAGALRKKMTVVLNDNMMSICPRVGSVGDYLDRVRMNRSYTTIKTGIDKFLNGTPLLGKPTHRFLVQLKESLKAGMTGGMLFEQLGFRYIGPVDGHNIGQLQKYLAMARESDQPVLLHVVTEKGHGFQPAADDPASFHAPAPFREENGELEYVGGKKGQTFTSVASAAIKRAIKADRRVAVITAAMCQGNKLEEIRDEWPEQFFDVGICESHAVAFAAGLAKGGMRPIVDIYSTFMQRSYDQIFQEVSLQDLPVTLMMDRAGLTGPDGPTHHGMFDLTYVRPLPNMTVMAPGDAADLEAMVDFAVKYDHPTAIRYPKAMAVTIEREQITPIEPGRAELVRPGCDGAIIACGSVLADCLEAAETLQKEDQLEIAVVNARFVKPLDRKILGELIRDMPFVLTVEEAALAGGFGSAVLELAATEGWDTGRIALHGVPDRYVEHGSRDELLAELELDAVGIASRARLAAGRSGRN
jgi:1-deoxy-D-xylulose-5-phosphate synthase